MQKSLLPVLCLVLAGCSNLEFPWVYRINVDQGNIITQEMVNKLKPGMTRSQVQFVMGSALLVDTFHDDRWDYLYTLLDGDGKRTEQRLTVFFEGDKLSALNGDFMPQADAPAAVQPEAVSQPQPEAAPQPANPLPPLGPDVEPVPSAQPDPTPTPQGN